MSLTLSMSSPSPAAPGPKPLIQALLDMTLSHCGRFGGGSALAKGCLAGKERLQAVVDLATLMRELRCEDLGLVAPPLEHFDAASYRPQPPSSLPSAMAMAMDSPPRASVSLSSCSHSSDSCDSSPSTPPAPEHDEDRPVEAPRTPPHPRRVVLRHQSVFCNQDVELGIFLLPKGASLPLHDHPDMCVISRMLYGTAHLQSFDWIDPGTSQHRLQGLVRQVSTELLTPESPCRVLFPTAGGNIHTFKALTDCAFIDLLLPPYDEVHRSCHYFEVVPLSEDHRQRICSRLAEQLRNIELFYAIQGAEPDPEVFAFVSEPYRGYRPAAGAGLSPDPAALCRNQQL